jgi:hypothetical protein
MLRLIAHVFFFSAAGCGALEISEYSPSPNRTVLTSPSNDPGLPDDPPLELSGTSRLASFDTGLTACVKESFVKDGTPVFAPQDLTSWSATFAGKPRLESDLDLYHLYDLVLRTAVTPKDGLVAYARLREGGDLSQAWTLIINRVADLDLGAVRSENERVALWINLYNLIMIDIIRADADALTQDKQRGTFGTTTRTVGGKPMTLDQIEYGVLRLATRRPSHEIPESALPSTIERRAHAALVCGARSCPKLRNFAYEPEALDAILNENIHMFFNSTDQHLLPAVDGNPPRFSALFNWFPNDFNLMNGNTSPGDSRRFLLPSCRNDVDPLGEYLVTLTGGFQSVPSSQILPYDWTTNTQ